MYTIEAAKKALKDGIEVYLLKDEKNQYIMKEVNRLPFYLEGAPGIGKTEIVSQIAQELGIGFVSFSLTHHTRNSLLGLPVIKDLECGKYTEYTMSEIIAKVKEACEAGKKEGILLLDEFSCVSDSIMPAMLAFLQTKNIGMHTLPEGWVIVLCGNPQEYNRSAKRFDPAIMDRIRKVSVTFDGNVFLEYAKEHSLHPAICEYLTVNPDSIYECVDNKSTQLLVTCRGWENLSHALYGMEKLKKEVDMELILQFIKSEEVAYNFLKSYRIHRVELTEKEIRKIIRGNHEEQYYEKYKDKNYETWWSMADIMGDYLNLDYSTLKTKNHMLKLAKGIVRELKKSNDVYWQIRGRSGECVYYEHMIPIWEKGNKKYQETSDIESDMLKEWIDRIENEECEKNFDEDQNVINHIMNWCQQMQVSVKKQTKDLSNDISHILRFLKLKDKSLEEKFYQLINRTDLWLEAVTKTKNKDYIRICKENHAIEE